jgi:hypothetical protein
MLREYVGNRAFWLNAEPPLICGSAGLRLFVGLARFELATP